MKKEELIAKCDQHIQELVMPKVSVWKSYNMYNCKMDVEQFRYLEENYGIGNPTSVKFVPLVKRHVDALIGEHLEIPLMPTVSCKDKRTISHILRDKQLRIKSEVKQYYLSLFRKNILLGITGNRDDASIDKALQDLIRNVNDNFVSEYEIASQNVLDYILQARPIDIYNKRKELMSDFLISGTCFYRAETTPDGHNINIRTFNPMNVFPEKNPDSVYVKDCNRIVVRHWLTKDECLNRYGRYLNSATAKRIEEMYRDTSIYTNTILVRTNAPNGQRVPISQHVGDDVNVCPGFPEENAMRYNYFIPVYEVEWVQADKEGGKYIMNRYRCVRIGEDVYVTFGKDENAIRSINDPTNVKLSVNGMFLCNRNNKPFSLVAACADIQDKYNIVHYLRENALSNSGGIGQFIDLAKLPAVLGDDWSERLEKQLAYMKQGAYLMDSSQDGVPMMNTAVNGYDNTIKIPTIQAFNAVLQSLEETCSSITGVFRERLNGIQTYDAVRNVQAGQRNSYTITKLYYQQMDSLDCDIMIDMLDQGKTAYKDGLSGELILGPEERRVFTALPEHFTVSDFDVHIPSSTKILEDMELMKASVSEFIKSGHYEPDLIMEAMTARSVTELKSNMMRAWKQKKEEENVLGKLQQQLEEANRNLQQLQAENKKLSQKVEQLNEAKLQIEKEKIEKNIELEFYKARTDDAYKKGLIRVQDERTELEEKQMHDGNPYNDIVNKSRYNK